MSWTPPQCVADDGLVNPDLFDVRASEMDTSTIYGSATALRSMATTVHDETAAMSSTWSGLPEGYEAPEQERVYALMHPAEQSADDFKTTLDAMARHLETYASALDGIKPRLAAFETRAATFRAEVINGVTVSTLEGRGAGVGDYVVAGLRWAGRLDGQTTVIPWTEDGPSVVRNSELLEEFQGFRVEISTASSQCANDINALQEFMPLAPLSPGPPAQVVPIGPGVQPGAAMPWGQARSEDRTCMETVAYGGLDGTASVLTGYKNFGVGIFEGATMMVLGRNPETGGMFEGDSYGQAWFGLGDLLFSTVLTTSTPGRLFSAFGALDTNQNRLEDFMDARTETVKNGWGSLIGYDGASPDDPWHRWKSDGVATYTESALNVATFFIPAGAAVKATGLSAKTVRVVAGAVDFAVPGGSWLVKTGVNASVAPRVLRLGAEVPVPNTAGLIAAVDGSVRVEVRVPGESVVPRGPGGSLSERSTPATPYDADTSRRATVNQDQAPARPRSEDVQGALERAPVDDAGRPVDHRTGEPLRADGPDGDRRWHLKWDPEAGEWVAENPGAGRTSPGDLPARGEPNSYGYDSNGDRLPYANHRPDYGPDQVREVWEAAKNRDGRVFVTNLEGKRVEVFWDPGEPATSTSPGRPAASRADLWDMGHLENKKYSDLRDRYLSGKISKEEFLGEYQDPRNYKVEDPGVNRSHANESQ